MTVRTEVESRLASLKLPTAFENVPFTPPAGDWIAVFFLTPNKRLVNLGADSHREEGMFQVSIYTKPGLGVGKATELVEKVKALFPVLPKVGQLSVEQPPSESRGFLDGDYWCVPVTVRYRAEL